MDRLIGEGLCRAGPEAARSLIRGGAAVFEEARQDDAAPRRLVMNAWLVNSNSHGGRFEALVASTQGNITTVVKERKTRLLICMPQLCGRFGAVLIDLVYLQLVARLCG